MLKADENVTMRGLTPLNTIKELDSVPDGVNLTLFDIPIETGGLSQMRPETKALMDDPRVVHALKEDPATKGTIPVFFVNELNYTDLAGVSNLPSFMAKGSELYGGAIFIDSRPTTDPVLRPKKSVLAHELTHILLDAPHYPSPKALWNYDFTGKKCYVWWGNISQGNGTWTETGILAHRRFRDSMRSRILKSKYVNP